MFYFFVRHQQELIVDVYWWCIITLMDYIAARFAAAGCRGLTEYRIKKIVVSISQAQKRENRVQVEKYQFPFNSYTNAHTLCRVSIIR